MTAASKLEVLRKHSEFLSVASSGKKWVARGFILQISQPHPPSTVIRYGLTASRRIGNAVERNRARRRMRALVRELMPHASAEHDYVFIARTTTSRATFTELKSDLLKGMKRMKVLVEDANLSM